MSYKIPFSGRAHQYTPNELNNIVETAKSAITLTQGRHLHDFEEAFKVYVGAERAFAVCNAASALELAAQLCCFKDGDEVIVPSHTYTASAYPFLKKGAKLAWADIDPITRVVTADTLRACINERTRVIVAVHLYGYGVDMPAVMALAKEHDLLVVEDAAQALGVKILGQKAGSFGDFGVFSFHSHKNVSTLGEGGMLTVRDAELAAVVPLLRHNGHTNFPEPQEDYWRPAMGNVDLPMLNNEVLMPNNYCLGEVECALGVLLLKRIDTLNSEKRTRALRVIDALAEYPQLQFHRIETERHNYHLLVARIANGWRDTFIRTMAGEHGVQCVVQYYPLNRYPFYEKLGYGNANCPSGDDFFDNMISFPFHHSLSEVELDYMINASKIVMEQLIV